MIEEQMYGPTLPFSEETHARKHRLKGETFREAMSRIANGLADSPEHFYDYRQILLEQKFLPGGRIQSAVGSPRKTTAFNCYVSRKIEDSMDGIMDAAKEAAHTMRLGGGIGYNFGSIRPKGDLIVSLDSRSSGPVSFMHIFDAVCKTVSSAGARRGAQMGVMPIDHPDIEEFIEAKMNSGELTQFNISIEVTDKFMEAVEKGAEFELQWEGNVYSRVDARNLWNKVMSATWDWAEPGILFADRINEMNNLYYCEEIRATNPCGEQPLPAYGACLLGSFNLIKYVVEYQPNKYRFDWDTFKSDIAVVVRAQDNVVDNTVYPLPEQEKEAKSKRRMGLGYTALANAGEVLGYSYASPEFLKFAEKVHKALANEAYRSSALLAKEKGSFPLFEKDKYLESKFIKRLDRDVRDLIAKHGIRNSHLTSIAPTGTISIGADNVSSGCEPVFSHYYDRTVINDDGTLKEERVSDYAYRVYGIKGKTAGELSTDEHLSVLSLATKWVDSAVSKTINVGDDVTWEEFKDIYMKAWKSGCKGVTTFRAAGKRMGILNEVKGEEGGACYIDPQTGKKSCD